MLGVFLFLSETRIHPLNLFFRCYVVLPVGAATVAFCWEFVVLFAEPLPELPLDEDVDPSLSLYPYCQN